MEDILKIKFLLEKKGDETFYEYKKRKEWDKFKKNVEEIKYFHPSGKKTMVNGHSIQRGGWLRECTLNENAFDTKDKIFFHSFNLNEDVHDEQYDLSNYRGN